MEIQKHIEHVKRINLHQTQHHEISRTRRQSTKDKPSSANQASERYWVFLGGQWLGNPPANAGVRGSVPGPGKILHAEGQ